MTVRMFDTKDEAFQFMVLRNRARTGPKSELAVLVDGPEDDFAVMELREAIENGFMYEWSA